MCMTGIGNSKGDYERLITALKDIKDGETKADSPKEAAWDAGALYELMNKRREMREIPGSWEWVKAEEADGRVAAESIVPYPPGIPLVCAGEVIDSESVLWAETNRKHGERVFGMTEEGLVKVGIL